MKKDKALGRDPLGWIKATREAESRQAGEVSKPEEQETSVTHAVNPPSFGQTEIKKPVDVEDAVRSQEQEVETQESGVTYERRAPSHKPSPVTSYERQVTSDERRVTNGSTIIFIIAYAVLLLVLTFFVYFNLSKRIDDMSSRISNMEKSLTQSSKRGNF